MFIVIEGLDGTGKSTLAKALAKKLDAELLSTPDIALKDARSTIDDAYQDSPLARQLFYASTVVDVSEKIKRLLSEGKNIVVDRYWLSTQVYHNWKSNGRHFDLDEVEQYLAKPDFTIYLNLPLAERKARLRNRAGNTMEDNLTLLAKNDERLKEIYLVYKNLDAVGRWINVNATINLDGILDRIISELAPN